MLKATMTVGASEIEGGVGEFGVGRGRGWERWKCCYAERRERDEE